MGVDFYACVICKETFPDCGSYWRCDYCEEVFCSSKCANPRHLLVRQVDDLNEEVDEEKEPECCICRRANASDSVLLNFCLKRLGLTREQAITEWQKEPPRRE